MKLEYSSFCQFFIIVACIISYCYVLLPISLTKLILMSEDYQIVKRSADQSLKHYFARFVIPNFDAEKAIVTSTADMEFKFSPAIYIKWLEKMVEKPPHFGYAMPNQSFWKALSDWVQTRYYRNAVVNQTTTVLWNNTVTSVSGIIEVLTKPDDQVLMICPFYYFFIKILKEKYRQVVEFVLDTKQNRFYIDFDKLEQKIAKNNIKMLIFCSPWNPCGRIWSKQELGKLAVLTLKYKFYLVSDQIYSDSVEPNEQQEKQGLAVRDIFTSMLVFQQIHKYLIYVNSYTKAFNSSGLPLSYSITFDTELTKQLFKYKINNGGNPCSPAYDLLQVIYTSTQAKQWKQNTIEYTFNNYRIFKKLCMEKLPKLIVYDMECSYLCLVDFVGYGLKGKMLQDKISSVQVVPTYMEDCFLTQREQSMVRFNLAMNVALVIDMVNRIQSIINEPVKLEQSQQPEAKLQQ